jgi:hypothetical protein
MSSILLLGYQAEKSGLDTGDFDLGEPLAVAHTLHVVLTATELDDADFIVTTLGDHFSHNGSTGNDWSANIDVVTIGNQQNAVEGNGFASSDFQFFNFQVFTWGDFVLLATSNDYCVRHGISPKILLTQLFIRRVSAGMAA